jgi:CheY-like chemotaxis protein
MENTAGAEERLAALENELKLSRLLEASRAEVLAVLDRELRTALSSIVGFSEIIERDPQVSDHVLRCAHNINLVGHDLTQLMDRLTHLSGSGSIEIDDDDEDVALLLKDLSSRDKRKRAIAVRRAARPDRAVAPRVLVVEDNAFNREVIVEQLRTLGYEPGEAASGEEALALGTDFDVVITDIHMPGMDGYELARRLRQDEDASGHGRFRIIIALTAEAGKNMLQHCLDSGMDDYMAKPIDINDLKARLEEWTK